MTVSKAVRKSLPTSRKMPGGRYPMPDKKHAAIAKAFAAMHHSPDKAEIDAKADRILRHTPRGSGPFDASSVVQGYAPVGGDAMYGYNPDLAAMQAWQAQQDKKKKRGG